MGYQYNVIEGNWSANVPGTNVAEFERLCREELRMPYDEGETLVDWLGGFTSCYWETMQPDGTLRFCYAIDRPNSEELSLVLALTAHLFEKNSWIGWVDEDQYLWATIINKDGDGVARTVDVRIEPVWGADPL